MNPQENINSRTQFWSKFKWKDSTLELDAKQAVEASFVEFLDIFARHRFGIRINTEFKEQITPLYDGPAHSQSFPEPIKLQDNPIVEVALLHKCGIITTLLFSKYANLTFAQRQPNGK